MAFNVTKEPTLIVII